MDDHELRAIERLALGWGPSTSDQCWLWHQKEHEAQELSDQQAQQVALDSAFQERFAMLQAIAKHRRASEFVLQYRAHEGSEISCLTTEKLWIWALGRYDDLPRAIQLLLRFADGDGGYSRLSLSHHLHRELIEQEEVTALSEQIQLNLRLAS